jgi:tripartite-type tricarboxylate transporter receptor subunit TctC
VKLSMISVAVFAAFAAPVALAQGSAGGYPSKALRMVVPFPPGGGNDILARTLGQRLSEVTGQQVVVDNRGGAGGALGATIAATANPDGYTLFLGSVGNLAQTPALKAHRCTWQRNCSSSPRQLTYCMFRIKAQARQ